MEIQADFSHLEKLLEELEAGYYVDVGILGDGETAEYMAKHEFGSVSEKLPRRSWLKMPIETRARDIAQSVQPKVKPMIEQNNIEGIFKIIGIACEAQIAEAFSTSGFGQWQELSEDYYMRPSGQLVDESSKPLLDTGAGSKSVTSKTGRKA